MAKSGIDTSTLYLLGGGALIYVLYKSDFFKGAGQIATGLGTGVTGLGEGVSTASQGLGQGIYQASTGLGTGISDIATGLGSPFRVINEGTNQIRGVMKEAGTEYIDTAQREYSQKEVIDWGAFDVNNKQLSQIQAQTEVHTAQESSVRTSTIQDYKTALVTAPKKVASVIGNAAKTTAQAARVVAAVSPVNVAITGVKTIASTIAANRGTIASNVSKAVTGVKTTIANTISKVKSIFKKK